MKKILKKKSKRIGTKQRVKTEKKVREHNRKLLKERRKNPGKFKKSKKDPGIPNACPFKGDVLREVDLARKMKQLDKEKKRALVASLRKNARAQKIENSRMGGIPDLLAQVQEKNENYDRSLADADLHHLVEDEGKSLRGTSDGSAKAYYREFLKVVETADVVLEILDARDPLGTRCLELEKTVLSTGATSKRLILILNKADLVPKENLQSWLNYLRQSFPTLAFKASTQTQNEHLGQTKRGGGMTSTSKCVGADTVMRLLANYSRCKDVRTAIRVGIVGMPNVGKSSIINSLKRSKACVVGSVPGVTKTLKEINLDSRVKLLDSPGVILNSSNTSYTLGNMNKSSIEAIESVGYILERCQKQDLMMKYNISSDFSSLDEFLYLVGFSIGRLLPGGIPDRSAAANTVLNDWNTGRIKYFTQPPSSKISPQISAQIVAQFSEEFDINNMSGMEASDMDALGVLPVKMDESTVSTSAVTHNDNITPNSPLCPVGPKKQQKLLEKKKRKIQRRNDKRAKELSDDLEIALEDL